MTRWPELPEHLARRVKGCIGSKPVRPAPVSGSGSGSKYGNESCEVDGIRFSSQLEARYYQRLKLLQRVGEVSEIKLQVPYILQPAYELPDGTKVRAIKYVADFVVSFSDGRKQVVDTKGMRTPIYKLKKKMLLYKYPEINFVEVEKDE